jgi:hypothetical protein
MLVVGHATERDDNLGKVLTVKHAGERDDELGRMLAVKYLVRGRS